MLFGGPAILCEGGSRVPRVRLSAGVGDPTTLAANRRALRLLQGLELGRFRVTRRGKTLICLSGRVTGVFRRQVNLLGLHPDL